MEAPAPRAEVTVYSPLFSPFRQPLVGETVSIGRAADCTIPIKDRYLSRKHAEIIASGPEWGRKHLGSANGTYLNGNRVEGKSPLANGDRIRLGDTEILFETSEHNTDRFLAVGDAPASATISIHIHEIDESRHDSGDLSKLAILNALARELIEDRPMDELFGFIVDRVLEHTGASRVAIATLSSDGKSFANVEVRRQDKNDNAELRISRTVLE